MNSSRSRCDLSHGCHVRFLFGLALDDQVAFPDLEPERALDGFLIIAHSQGKDEIRLILPGEFEFDSRPGREA